MEIVCEIVNSSVDKDKSTKHQQAKPTRTIGKRAPHAGSAIIIASAAVRLPNASRARMTRLPKWSTALPRNGEMIMDIVYTLLE